MDKLAIIFASLSLFISFVSLCFAFKKDRLEKRIITAQKKTDALKHISASRSKFERQLEKLQSMKSTWELCQSCPSEKIATIENNTIKLIEIYKDQYEKVSSVKETRDPVFIEKLIPHYYDVQLQAEDLYLDILGLVDGCLDCRAKASEKE